MYPVELAPLSCWSRLSDAEWRARCAAIVREIEEETRQENAARGRAPLGAAHVLAQHPHARPRRIDRSPAPLVHAATRRARETFPAVYRAFVDAFRTAAERVRQGETPVEFPLYAFPPGAPFVGDRRAASPPSLAGSRQS